MPWLILILNLAHPGTSWYGILNWVITQIRLPTGDCPDFNWGYKTHPENG